MKMKIRLAALCLILAFVGLGTVPSTAQTISTNDITINFSTVGVPASGVNSVTIQRLYWMVNGNAIYANEPTTLTRYFITNGVAIFTNQVCGVPYDLTFSAAYGTYETNFLIAATNGPVTLNSLNIGQYGTADSRPYFWYASSGGTSGGGTPLAAGFGTILTTANGTNTLAVDPTIIATNYIFKPAGNLVDSTAIIQSKLGNGTFIFSPGDYWISNTITIPNNCFISGYGATVHATNITGFAFLMPSNAVNVQIMGLTLSGGTETNLAWETGPSIVSAGVTNGQLNLASQGAFTNRSGFQLNMGGGGVMSDCKVTGFPGYGILEINTNSSEAYRFPKFRLRDTMIDRNFIGVRASAWSFDFDPTGAAPDMNGEYLTFQGVVATRNSIGIDASAGNNNISGSVVSGNFIAVYGGAGHNAGHGIVIGNNVNHNTYPVWWQGSGESFVQNDFFANSFGCYFDACPGLMLDGNHFNVGQSVIITNTYAGGAAIPCYFINNSYAGIWASNSFAFSQNATATNTYVSFWGNYSGNVLGDTDHQPIGGTNAWTQFNSQSNSFTGSGANLTGVIHSLPTGIVTNNATGVTLSGTFTGDGTGVTNIVYANTAQNLGGPNGSPNFGVGGATVVVTNSTVDFSSPPGFPGTGLKLKADLFTGNGSGLTNLNATMLATGTVGAAQLGNAALLAGTNAFTGTNKFGGYLIISADGTSGFFGRSGNTIDFKNAGATVITIAPGSWDMKASYDFGWCSTTPDVAPIDTHMFRSSAGVVNISQATTGQSGSLLVSNINLTGTAAAANGFIANPTAGTTNSPLVINGTNGVPVVEVTSNGIVNMAGTVTASSFSVSTNVLGGGIAYASFAWRPTNLFIAWTGTKTNWVFWNNNGTMNKSATNVNNGGWVDVVQ